MTSKERHEARYQRRKAKRIAKTLNHSNKELKEVMSFEHLNDAGLECCHNVRWKTSTINFETYLLTNSLHNYNALINKNYQSNGFTSFYLYEHGKLRDIDAMSIKDRQVQKCLCHNYLDDNYTRSFVYDNGACLKDKGMDFQLNRLKKHLHDHYRKYGTEGGIYQFDFDNFFKSLSHSVIKEHNQNRTANTDLYNLFNNLVDDFDNMKVIQQQGYGVGLGGEVSQLIALEYANPLDHYIKDVLQIHGFGRYNDDSYIISNSLEELQEIKQKVEAFAQDLGITINKKKNKITPFKHHSFKFLKIRFTLTDTGKVVMKVNKKTVSVMRSKLKTFRKWVDDGRMDAEDAFQSYQSFRAHLRRCNSYQTLHNMDIFFVQLFKKELSTREKRFPCTLKSYNNNGHWIYTYS